MDEAFYRQFEAALKSQTLAPVGDFNYPDICCTTSPGKHKPPRRFLKSTDPTRNVLLLDLTLINREGIVGNMKFGGSLGCVVTARLCSSVLREKKAGQQIRL